MIEKKQLDKVIIYCTKNMYFLTYGDLEMYCKSNNISMSNAYTLEYYRNFAGNTDVIKVKGNWYTAIDEDGYAVYNRKENKWKYEYGHLRNEYKLLKDIGVDLENDIYEKIDKRNANVLKSLKENILDDNYGKKDIKYLSSSSNYIEDKHFTMIEKSCGDDVQPNIEGVKKTAKMLLRRRSIEK